LRPGREYRKVKTPEKQFSLRYKVRLFPTPFKQSTTDERHGNHSCLIRRDYRNEGQNPEKLSLVRFDSLKQITVDNTAKRNVPEFRDYVFFMIFNDRHRCRTIMLLISFVERKFDKKMSHFLESPSPQVTLWAL
jgi:hypothetical protein